MKWGFLLLFEIVFLPQNTAGLHAQPVDIYGYLESQYTGMYLYKVYYQFQSSKLRIDLKSTSVAHTEFGADFINLLYCGKRNWNILEFLPDKIVASLPTEMYPLFQFAYEDSFYPDNIYARIGFNRFALTIGKQQISMGTGYFFNPTDVFNVKNMLDPTYEQPGHNAIRMDISLKSRFQVMALVSPINADWEHSGKFMRIKCGIGHFDFSVIGGKLDYSITDFYNFQTRRGSKKVLGGDVVGELIGLGVWAEGAYNYLDYDEDFYEFTSGTDYTLNSGFYTLIEYHRNSLAKADYTGYDLNDWMGFLTGETRSISRDEIACYFRYPATDLLTISTSIVTSISDGSAVFVPTIEYSLFENINLSLMVNLYTGKEGKAFGRALGNGGLLRATLYF